MSILSTTTVGQLVAERPGRSRVFEALGIDYCCGGKLPLEAACRARGLDVRATIDRLEGEDAAQGGASAQVGAAMSLAELADHIEREHHDRLRAELPRLLRLAQKVEHAHGTRDERLHKVRAVLADFTTEMFQHMLKEERVLFPMIRALEHAGAATPGPRGSVARPIAQMEAEHDHAGGALASLRDLTDGFTPPAGACNSYRALLDGLAELERDTHQHVHKENNLLFPGAARLEQTLRPGGR
jgi:regulator of cell morphogenesis and NO signaling